MTRAATEVKRAKTARRWLRFATGSALALMTALAAAGSPAVAQDRSCRTRVTSALADDPGEPLAAVGIDISTPLPRDRVRGVTKVEGTANSADPLDRVELLWRGTVVDHQDLEPGRDVSFSLLWNTNRGDVGPNVLQVVACGSSAVGVSSVEITVPPRRPLWVGLLVGLTGLVGLILSLVHSSRHAGKRARINGMRRPDDRS